MDQTNISKMDVRGTASGVLFMAFFGTMWADIGIGGLQGWGSLRLLIIAIVIGGALFGLGYHLLSASRRLPNVLNHNPTRQPKRVGLWFSVTFIAEFALIGLAAAFLNGIHHFEWFFPAMALIVGAHFFPLAYLFQVKIHYVAGSLLCLLAIVTVLFVPFEVTLGQHEISAWWSFVGFGSALILWGTGVVIWLMGYRLLKVGNG